MSHGNSKYLDFVRACTELATESATETGSEKNLPDRVYVPAAIVLRDVERRAQRPFVAVTVH